MNRSLIPAVIAAFVLLAARSAPATFQSDWKLTLVDSAPGSGFGVNLALDSAGLPSISYYRPTTGFPGFFDVYFARLSGGTWSTEPVFSATSDPRSTALMLTELGNPAVVYSRGTLLEYSLRTGGSWNSKSVSNAGGGAISALWGGTEAAPDFFIAFNDTAGADLELARPSGNTFLVDSLDTANAGQSCSFSLLGAYGSIIYVKSGKLAHFETFSGGATWGNDMTFPANITASRCAVTLAPATKGDLNQPRNHVIFYDGTTGVYSYLHDDTDTGVWASPEIIATSAVPPMGFPYFGLSIAVGSDRVVRVAYLDYQSLYLFYARRLNGAWTQPSVVGLSQGGVNCSLRLTADNSPRIAYAELVVNNGTYQLNGVSYVEPASDYGRAPTRLDFRVIHGKATTKPRVVVKGDASPIVVAIEWKVGKMTFRKKKVVLVSGRWWSIKVGPLALGKNKAKFRAVGEGGKVTATQTVTIIRKLPRPAAPSVQ